jgi:hypothetical protein
MHMRLASASTVGQVMFIFRIQEFIPCRAVLGEYEHSGSKKRDPPEGTPKHKIAISSKKIATSLIKYQYFTEIVAIKRHCVIKTLSDIT